MTDIAESQARAQVASIMVISNQNFPEAFSAMDEAASEFWAYPDEEWQEQFLRDWANSVQDEALLAALS